MFDSGPRESALATGYETEGTAAEQLQVQRDGVHLLLPASGPQFHPVPLRGDRETQLHCQGQGHRVATG